MKQTGVLPLRVRALAIVTGIAGIITFFPSGLFSIQPVLLIAGAMTQHHFQREGRWLLGLGAAGLSIILAQYNVLLFQHPVPPGEYARLPFPFPLLLLATTLLALWYDMEFAVDCVRLMRTQHSDLSRDPTPVSPGTWIFAALLNLWIGWSAVWALRRLHQSGSVSTLLTSGIWVLAVVVFDIGLVRRAVSLRQVRHAGTPPSP